MDDRSAATADALELRMNQTALRAAIDEVSTWIRKRGSVNIHDNAMTVFQAPYASADALTLAISSLRP